MFHRAPIAATLLLAMTACAGNATPLEGANATSPTATAVRAAAAGASEVKATTDPMASAPWAENVEDPLSDGALIVSVTGDAVILGGAAVDEVQSIRRAGRPLRLVGLFDALKAARERWVAEHPARPFPGLITFHFDENEPAAVVKSVFQTAAFAAYPNASFEVRAIPEGRRARITADAQVPDPRPGKPQLDEEEGLDVQVQAQRIQVAWKKGTSVLATQTLEHPAVVSPRGAAELIRVPAVGSVVASQWNEHGAHRRPDDATLDRAVVHVDNDVPFKLLVAALDAIHEVKRERVVEGTAKRLSAMHLTLAIK